MNLKNFCIIFLSFFISTSLMAEDLKLNEDNNTELNFYTGMFDFSDDGKRAGLVGTDLAIT